MWSAKPPRMPKIRTRLESYVVRNTADIVDDLSDERREELAEVLHDLEGHSPRAEEAERLTEDLVEKLEHRNIVIAKSRARIEELERELAKARAEAGDREERITDADRGRAHPDRRARAGFPQRARGPGGRDQAPAGSLRPPRARAAPHRQ